MNAHEPQGRPAGVPLPPPLRRDRQGWPWTEADPPPATAMPDGSPWPRITLVTPSFNQAGYLEHTLRSVFAQGYPNLEYIVMDGGSTDGSVEIIRHYAGGLAHWTSAKDRGQSHALNTGFARGTGTLFGWINSDDWLAPGALCRAAALAAAHPEAPAWVGACEMHDGEDRSLRIDRPRIGAAEDFGDWFENGYLVQPACFFSAARFREVGGLEERYHFLMDVDLWMRLRALGDFAVCDDVLAHARLYAEAKTQRDAPMREAELIAINLARGYPAMARRRLLAYAERRLRGAENRCRRAEARVAELEQQLWPPHRWLRHAAGRLWRTCRGKRSGPVVQGE